MKWKIERDLLIAQTMAFVQSVSGRKTDGEGQVEPAPPDQPAEVERSVEPVAATRPVPAARPALTFSSDIREEIQGRVAAFRAHQELFHRDRDAYCKSVLAKARTATESSSNAPDGQPIKD